MSESFEPPSGCSIESVQPIGYDKKNRGCNCKEWMGLQDLYSSVIAIEKKIYNFNQSWKFENFPIAKRLKWSWTDNVEGFILTWYLLSYSGIACTQIFERDLCRHALLFETNGKSKKVNWFMIGISLNIPQLLNVRKNWAGKVQDKKAVIVNSNQWDNLFLLFCQNQSYQFDHLRKNSIPSTVTKAICTPVRFIALSPLHSIQNPWYFLKFNSQMIHILICSVKRTTV